MADIPLKAFRATTAGLSAQDRGLIVRQALRILQGVYVHGVGELSAFVPPALRRLEALLTPSTRVMPEWMFHDQLIDIFKSLRDHHTHYVLPKPFVDQVCFLPFAVRDCFEDGQRQYIVTMVDPDTAPDPQFVAGVEVTHWNQVPITQLLRDRADKEDGAHAAARHARAMASLTARPAWLLALPEEDAVTVGYSSAGVAREARFEWRARRLQKPLDKSDGFLSAIDVQSEAIRQFETELFARNAVAKSDAMTSAVERLAEVGIGYIRLTKFDVVPDRFVPAFAALLAQQPRSGLIIDIRENPGGMIPAGEQALQLLTPGNVEPTRWQFRATPETLAFSKKIGLFAPYLSSLSLAMAAEVSFSDALPVTSPTAANAVGQVYQGPIVLITDALTYSVGDLFAAGFQDHLIGQILGSDEATGGGGSNDIAYEPFSAVLPEMFSPLPAGASFRISTRRCFRVREKAGTLIERQGVRADQVHRATRADRLDGDRDLLERAEEVLSASPSPARSLEVVATVPTSGDIRIRTTTQALSRLDLFVDGRPFLSPDVDDGTQEHVLGADKVGAVLEVRGFAANRLAVSRKVVLEPS